MKGKTVLITGADGGIGRETTKAIAMKGASIIMACIDTNQARPVLDSISRESGNKRTELIRIDLGSLNSIREFANYLSKKYGHLDILINNAGTFSMKRQETGDGFEKTIGINYLGTFLLTNLLLPMLSLSPEARIISLSSNAYSQGNIDLNDFHIQKKYTGFKAYATSKLAIVFFTQELAERLKGTNITVNCLHPGHVATNIWKIWPEDKWYQLLLDKIINRFMITSEDGAQTSIYLATSDEVKGITGKYFDKKTPVDVSKKGKDLQLQKALWEKSEKLTGIS